MRIRQVKPAFWSDEKLAELPESTRLFYVGLWMIADDAGWLRWNAIEVARDLYGYESRGRRERRTAAMFDALVAAKRVVVHPCGHAEIPRMVTHQRLSGPTKQVQTTLNEHLRVCHSSPSPAGSRDDPQSPANPRPERNGTDVERGTVRNGKGTGKGSAPAKSPNGAGALDEDDVPPFLRAVQ
jgi:hypothetical protein